MNKRVLYFLTVVIVSARCSAESIPAISGTSNIAVANSTRANEHGKPNTRVNDEAMDEERAPASSFAIESFLPTLKIVDESRRDTTIMMDVSLIKVNNKVLAARLEKLGVNIDGVVALANALNSKRPFTSFNRNNFEWMVLGKVFFDKAGSRSSYRDTMRGKTLFKETNMRIQDKVAFEAWTKSFRNFHIRTQKIFGKMLWLMRRKELNLHLGDAAKMAFGSEYLNKRKSWVSDRIKQAMSEHDVVDKILFKYLKKLDKDPKWEDLTAAELLKKAIHENAADELQKQPAEIRIEA